jgi:glycosyltransferase involved in cell wall biosynthesis
MRAPRLAIIVPCFNEEEVLPTASAALGTLLDDLVRDGVADPLSYVLWVDDGSQDRTWALIAGLSASPRHAGLKLSGNRGHQNAILAGLLNAVGDVTVTVDADLQDDLDAIGPMLAAFGDGADIVYGVRASRDTDTAFKRLSAEAYYRLLHSLGVDIVFNHADYRLMSRRAVEALREFGETNLFLRGIIPKLGFRTAKVSYDRKVRAAGASKYTLRRMLSLAIEGITSFSTRPLRWISVGGIIVSTVSFIFAVWALLSHIFGATVPGWASTVIPLYFLGGIQLFSVGVIGEYIGKIYLESKRRPRFIVEESVNLDRREGDRRVRADAS